ncbi:unnamed protein product [Ranitomeya imitator]|uniref:Helicase C-terminal domain-containing protein n=1 Tax=Ranitomeya imitator TaxID=111125 RepID=A0ABN9LA17_9NEOB|nr:unnamed protein product [Ranitomeya imitator]
MEIFVDDETKLTLHGLQQYYVKLKDNEKNRKLFDLLDLLEFNQVVIFVKSVQRCIALAQLLVEQNFPAIAIHRGMGQEERLSRYQQFKDFQRRILVATNLFGRGMDIERVNIAFNYDMPEDSDTYLHRVARAGRFGTKGLAITFVSDEGDAKILNEVQDRFEVNISELPDEIDISSYSNIGGLSTALQNAVDKPLIPVVIFVKSVQRCIALAQLLVEQNFPAIAIHRGMGQEERLSRYQQFKDFQRRILVATNLFGRGMDIERVNIAFNYDMPEDSDTYLHRVARAGRFGTKGLAITFVSDEGDAKILNEVQDRFEVNISELPDEIDISSYNTSSLHNEDDAAALYNTTIAAALESAAPLTHTKARKINRQP